MEVEIRGGGTVASPSKGRGMTMCLQLVSPACRGRGDQDSGGRGWYMER